MTIAASNPTLPVPEHLLQALRAGVDIGWLLLPPGDRVVLAAAAQPRRFDRGLLRDEILPAARARDPEAVAELAADALLAHLASADMIRRVAGRPDWWEVAPDRRDALLNPAPASLDALGALDAWSPLHARLASAFEAMGADAELEALYHRLTVRDPAAAARWRRLYDEARGRFDLARCETLLDLLAQRSRFLTPELASAVTAERVLLETRAGFADDFFRTSRYVQREQLPFRFGPGAPEEHMSLPAAIERMARSDTAFLLELHAPGGSGKTMGVRWLAARWCLPEGLPIARIDFDFLGDSERHLAPVFLLGRFIERLDLQIAGRPLFELLADIADVRRLDGASLDVDAGTEDEAARQARLVAFLDEVVDRSASILAERVSVRAVVLVLDTLEEAGLRHEIDLRGLVGAVERLGDRMRAFRADAPRVLLVASGRYTLAEQFPDARAAFDARCVSGEVVPFSELESRDYLARRLTGVPESPRPDVVTEAVARAHGIPFKLSLYADVFIASPRIRKEELGADVDVDMLYLVERVLKRVRDPALRWVLRYGVLARRFTRGFLEHVLLERLARPLRGELADDDPARDAVRHRDWLGLWRIAAKGAPPDPGLVWKSLREFASASSWIGVDPAVGDAVVIQPVVALPMRRALASEDRPAVQALHRDAVAWARRRLRDDGPAAIPEALADLTFHDFMSRGDAAARAWERRLREQERAEAAEAVLALATAVLGDDLVEAAPGFAARSSLRVQARAHVAIARQLAGGAGRSSAEGTGAGIDLARARAALARHDALLPPTAVDGVRAVPLFDEGRLRLFLAATDDKSERALALRQLEASLATRLSREDRAQALQLLARGLAELQDERAMQFDLMWGRFASRTGDVEGYVKWIGVRLREALARAAPRGAFALAHDVRERLKTGAFAQAAPPARRDGRRYLDAWMVDALAAGHHGADALKSFLALRQPSAGQRDGGQEPSLSDASERAVRCAELELQSGDALGALQRLARNAKVLAHRQDDPLPLPMRAGEAFAASLRVRAGIASANAARALGDFGAALDALSEVIAEQSRVGDRFGESLSRLHVVWLHLDDLGDLAKAERHLRDREGGDADEAPELRVATLLLLAALHGARGESTLQAGCVSEARDRLAGVPPERWRVRVHVALAGLSCPLAEPARHVDDLAEALAVPDHAALRLNALRGLRRVAPLMELSSRQAGALERLGRLAPIATHRRWLPHDRAVATLHRIELLRVLGRQERAVEELRGLAPALRRLGPVLLWRDVALACDRLAIDPAGVLTDDWLVAMVRRWGRQHAFCARLQAEAATRALQGDDPRAAVRLARRALDASAQGKGGRSGALVPALWQLQALQILLDVGLPDAAERQAMRRRRDGLATALGQGEIRTPVFRQPPASVLKLDLRPPRFGLANVAAPSPAPEPPRPLDAMPFALEVQPSSRASEAGVDSAEPVLESLHLGNAATYVDHQRWTAWHGRSLPGSAWRFTPWLLELAHSLRRNASTPVGPQALDPRQSDMGWQQAAPALPPSFCALLASASAWPASASRPLALVESVHPALHGLPWELLVPPGATLPLALHEGLRRFWRGRAEDVVRMRTIALQRALGLVVDGVFGPATDDALRRFCVERGLPLNAGADAVWEAGLEAQQALPRSDAANVLLLQTSAASAQSSLRGYQLAGGGLPERYATAGVQVNVLTSADLSQLHAALSMRPHGVLHLATPISRSRSTGELSLQFSGRHEASRGTAFEPEVLARALSSMPSTHVPSMILVEPPGSSSRDETLRQLLDRNEFAARLQAAAGGLPVLATGLAPPQEQWRYADLFAKAAHERWTAARLLDRLRAIGRERWSLADTGAGVDLLQMLPDVGAALFACEPLVRTGAAAPEVG